MKTTNGGTEWVQQNVYTLNPLNSIYFTDINTGWVVGGAGTIISTTTGDTYLNISPGGSIMKNFLLFQNYPNPFNNQTIIKIQILEPTLISLNIYDITGQKVKTIVDNLLLYGEKEFIWNTAKNSSGIYFYRIESADFSETKKCILIK